MQDEVVKHLSFDIGLAPQCKGLQFLSLQCKPRGGWHNWITNPQMVHSLLKILSCCETCATGKPYRTLAIVLRLAHGVFDSWKIENVIEDNCHFKQSQRQKRKTDPTQEIRGSKLVNFATFQIRYSS